MELRAYKGCFVIGDRESEEVDLRVILSTGGGVTEGSGSFSVPASLVGQIAPGLDRFRTRSGDDITLNVCEIDPTQGEAYFLTGAGLPVEDLDQTQLSPQNKGVA
jgi:hypothetical protein